MLKAGFSRMDVTPPLGSFVAGDFSERYSKTVLDPLYLNALALSYGDEKVLIIACDFLFIQRIYCDNLRAMIGERVSIPADNVMLCSLHQHSSIMISDKITKTNNVMRDTAYLNVLNRKFGDVAAMAMEDLKEAEKLFAVLAGEALVAISAPVKMENAQLELKGRHDPCVVHRAVPVIEAAAALAACQVLGI